MGDSIYLGRQNVVGDVAPLDGKLHKHIELGCDPIYTMETLEAKQQHI